MVLTFLKSQQEPRLLASYAKDETMLNAYRNGKDLYATIASQIYHNNYEDNLEHYPDGTKNPDGEKRRSSAKSTLLGILYGLGTASLAEKIKCTKEEADTIIKTFYQQFPQAKKWMDETEKNAKDLGYVEDMWGRRRRLPDIQLPKYTITDKKSVSSFNPILGCRGIVSDESETVSHYRKLLDEAYKREDIERIKKKASFDGLTIRDNGGFIAQAQRQCVNSRIQGGAATMSKIAMLHISKDKKLKDLGFRLQIAIHDEVIGECPVENADEVANRLVEIMVNCAKDTVVCPMKCDPTIEHYWYEEGYKATLKKEYDGLLKEHNESKAKRLLIENHIESTEKEIESIFSE